MGTITVLERQFWTQKPLKLYWVKVIRQTVGNAGVDRLDTSLESAQPNLECEGLHPR